LKIDIRFFMDRLTFPHVEVDRDQQRGYKRYGYTKPNGPQLKSTVHGSPWKSKWRAAHLFKKNTRVAGRLTRKARLF